VGVYCRRDCANAGRQTRIIWLIYWGSDTGTCGGKLPDYLTIIKVRASLLLHPPSLSIHLSLSDTFGKQSHEKRQNINGLSCTLGRVVLVKCVRCDVGTTASNFIRSNMIKTKYY
jgi:hypothetical protein